jgi:hypothetical protein
MLAHAASRSAALSSDAADADLVDLDLADLDLSALHLGVVPRRDGTFTVFARGVDIDGRTHMLAMRIVVRQDAGTRVTLFAGLLQRGLRAHRAILVSTDRSQRVAMRVRSAFGARAVFLDT